MLVFLVCLAVSLGADALDDLNRAKSDFSAIKSKIDDTKSKSDRYLEESRSLRTMDKEQLGLLVDQLCKLDTEPNDDEVDRLARDLRESVIGRVVPVYETTNANGMRNVEDIERS